MKKVLSLLVLVLACGFARAEPPTTESIERLLRVTRSEALVERMYTGLQASMRQVTQQALDGKLTPEQQRVLDEGFARVIATVRQEFNWETLKPEYIRIYQESFDQKEIDGLLAFYESPAGQAMISKMPTVMDKSIALSQAKLKTLMPRMMSMLEQSIKEAKAAK